jgi:hypothetical protein
VRASGMHLPDRAGMRGAFAVTCRPGALGEAVGGAGILIPSWSSRLEHAIGLARVRLWPIDDGSTDEPNVEPFLRVKDRAKLIDVTDEASRVLDAAMKLPDTERAELALILLDSVGDGSSPEEVEAAWIEEAKRRAASLILEVAVRLSESERAAVAAELEDSVGASPSLAEIEEAWIAEAEREREDLRAGEPPRCPGKKFAGRFSIWSSARVSGRRTSEYATVVDAPREDGGHGDHGLVSRGG